MKCILCGKETEGSTGAAGIHWPNICQECKDEEDNTLAARIKTQTIMTKYFDPLIDSLRNHKDAYYGLDEEETAKIYGGSHGEN